MKVFETNCFTFFFQLIDVVNEEDLNSFLSIEAMNTQNLTDKTSSKSDLDFTDLAKYGIIEMAGDDLYGRKIITIYACKLPPNNTIDHDKLLKYAFRICKLKDVFN